MFSSRIYQFLATLSATSAVISFGINSSWSSPYLPYLLSNSSIINTTSTEGYWCAVAPLVGCILGALIAANIVDRLGRKTSVLLMSPITIGSFIAMAFVKYIWGLTALRFTVGITEGALYAILPMYVGEIVEPDIRGFASSLLSILYFAGALLINSIGPFTSIYSSSLIISVFPTLHFITFLLMPESPYFYVKVGKYTKAENSLKKLRGRDNVEKELELLKEINNVENLSKAKFTDLFTVASNRKAWIIFITILTVSRLAGKTPVMLFTTTIFLESGSTLDPSLSVIMYSVIEVITVTSMGLLIDKFGKRFLIISSGIGCSITTFLLGTYFYLKESNSPVIFSLNWLPITSLILHNVSYSLGFGYCVMTYLSELFPMSIKSKATCLAEITSVILGITTSQLFQFTYTHFGMSLPFLFFSVTTSCGVFLIYKLVPETTGKSLAEIQDFLTNSCQNKHKL